MDVLLGPVGDFFQDGEQEGKDFLRDGLIALLLLVEEDGGIIVRHLREKGDLLRDAGEDIRAALHELSQAAVIHVLPGEDLVKPRGGHGEVGFGVHLRDILAVHPLQLVNIENAGRVVDAVDVEGFHQFREGEELPVRAGIPADEREIVDQRLSQEPLIDIIGIIGVAVPLGELMGSVPHDGGQVDIGRDLPAQGGIQIVVPGRGGQVFHAAHDVGDAHEVIVDNVGEIIGGHAVLFDEDHVIHGLCIFEGHIAEDYIAVAGFAIGRGVHADRPGDAGCLLRRDLFRREMQAVLVIFPGTAGGFHSGTALLDLLLGAEAVIGMAGLYKLLRIGEISGLALGLDIGTAGTADIGAFVPVQAAGTEGIVDDLGRAFNKAFLVGILDAQDEAAVVLLRVEVGVEGGADTAEVHEAGGAWSESCSNLHFISSGNQNSNREGEKGALCGSFRSPPRPSVYLLCFAKVSRKPTVLL